MPLLTIKTSASLSEEKKKTLLKAATKVLVDLGKKESSAMVLLETVDASMGGKLEPVAVAEFRSMIFQSHEQNNLMSEKLCRLFEEMLDIPNDRVFIHVLHVPEPSWGWKGGIVVWDNPSKKWVVR